VLRVKDVYKDIFMWTQTQSLKNDDHADTTNTTSVDMFDKETVLAVKHNQVASECTWYTVTWSDTNEGDQEIKQTFVEIEITLIIQKYHCWYVELQTNRLITVYG
jgi:hypothetical protein